MWRRLPFAGGLARAILVVVTIARHDVRQQQTNASRPAVSVTYNRVPSPPPLFRRFHIVLATVAGHTIVTPPRGTAEIAFPTDRRFALVHGLQWHKCPLAAAPSSDLTRLSSKCRRSGLLTAMGKERVNLLPP